MHLPVSSSKSPASRHGKHDWHPELPRNATSTRSRIFGAAVIRLSSDSHACSTHRLHLLQSIYIHLSSRALYTTQHLIRYRYQAVASLRDRHRQLSRLDFHQLDCSLVGCSLPHTALQLVVSSSGLARQNVGIMHGDKPAFSEESIWPLPMITPSFTRAWPLLLFTQYSS